MYNPSSLCVFWILIKLIHSRMIAKRSSELQSGGSIQQTGSSDSSIVEGYGWPVPKGKRLYITAGIS